MIIECPACDSRYRINPDKLPAEGGNIKCPNCSEVFFVNRQAPEADIMQPLDMPPPTGPAASSPVAPAAAAGAPKSEAWKVKNAVGLIYAFTDAAQLQRWLSNRESSDGLQVSNDGGDSWGPVSSYPALSSSDTTSGPMRTMMGIGAVGAGAAPAPAMTAEQMREKAQARLREARRARGVATTPPPQPAADSRPTRKPQRERPSQGSNYRRLKPPEEKPSASRLLVVLGIFIVPLVAAVALEMAGVISINEMISGLMSPREEVYIDSPTVANEQTDAGTVETAQDEPRSNEAQAEEQMNAAAALLAQGDRMGAIAQMERAAYFDRDEYEIQCQLAPLYRSVGRNLQANQAQDRCNAGLAEDGLLPQEENVDGTDLPQPGAPTDLTTEIVTEPSQDSLGQ